MGAPSMDARHDPPDDTSRRITEPLPVRPPLPLEDQELRETQHRLIDANRRLTLLSAQVALIRRIVAHDHR